MVESNYNTVIDISSIIWDKNDYETNTENYFDLIVGVSNFLEKVRNENLKVLGRDELLYQMIDGFPFDNLPNKFYEFGNIVFSFLANTGSNFISYPETTINNLDSEPELVRTHYKDRVKQQIGYLISKIHSDDETESKYFTFNYLWNGNDNLKTRTEDKTNTYETIIADNDNDLDNFFAKYKLIFEHKKPKHDCSIHKNKEAWVRSEDKGNFQSQLSSFCDKNKTVVQEILNKRYHKCFGNELYYGYDKINNVYVAFRITLNNEYHAYDLYDIESVPNEVKKAFNVWKY